MATPSTMALAGALDRLNFDDASSRGRKKKAVRRRIKSSAVDRDVHDSEKLQHVVEHGAGTTNGDDGEGEAATLVAGAAVTGDESEVAPIKDDMEIEEHVPAPLLTDFTHRPKYSGTDVDDATSGSVDGAEMARALEEALRENRKLKSRLSDAQNKIKNFQPSLKRLAKTNEDEARRIAAQDRQITQHGHDMDDMTATVQDAQAYAKRLERAALAHMEGAAKKAS